MEQLEAIRYLRKLLDDNGYNENQFGHLKINILVRALMNDLDISKFAKPEFSIAQLNQFINGYYSGILNFCDPRYTASQLSRIRNLLCSNKKCTILDPNRDKDLNDIILKCLGYDFHIILDEKDGLVDTYDYVSLNSYLYNNILSYIRTHVSNEIYAEFLESNRFDEIYEELFLFLKNDLDIFHVRAIYNNREHLRQIRLGLLNSLDIQKYIYDYFDPDQMEEIRLGLLEGVDVTFYNYVDYPASLMQKIRHALLFGDDVDKIISEFEDSCNKFSGNSEMNFFN